MIVEVHDVDGRLERVRALLASKGFEVEVGREDWALHPLLGISTLFARRPAATDPVAGDVTG